MSAGIAFAMQEASRRDVGLEEVDAASETSKRKIPTWTKRLSRIKRNHRFVYFMCELS